MRIAVSRMTRVGPGDKIVIQARLAAGASRLGRLFVFARARPDTNFSPYVAGIGSGLMIEEGEPRMYSPLSLRLTEGQPARQLKFTADIDGHIQVMQEVDTADEPLAKVKLQRKICSGLGWKQWLSRIWPW